MLAAALPSGARTTVVWAMTNVCLWCVLAWLSRLLVLARAVASARNHVGGKCFSLSFVISLLNQHKINS